MITNRSRHVMDEGSGSNLNYITRSEDLQAQIRIISLASPHARHPARSPAIASLLANQAISRLPLVRELACPWRACRLGARSVANDGDDGAHDGDDGADGRMTVQMMVQMDDASLPSLSLAVCRLRELGFRHAN